jgi:superfamily II DNA or RNA helicase
LEEKLLCPFHYFGVADPIAINGDQFWRYGKYNDAALEYVYVDHARAGQRVEAIIAALHRYEPEFSALKGIGFCVTIRHARFMAERFNHEGIPSAAFVSGIDDNQCSKLLDDLKDGRITFLLGSKLSEGWTIPR